jgi:hypothetical protein
MLNFEHEIGDIRDRYLRYFFGYDYFHDGVIHNIELLNDTDIELTISCNREWEDDLHNEQNSSIEGYNDFKQHIFDDKYKYKCTFKDCRYLNTKIFENGYIYLNGRFKDSAIVREINEGTNKHFLHIRMQTTGGYIDIVFSKFKIKRILGDINIPKKVSKRLIFEHIRKRYEKIDIETIRHMGEYGDDIDRMFAISYLGYVKDGSVLGLALKALHVEDTQISAIWVLGNIGDSSLLPLLYEEWAASKGKFKRHLQDAIEKIIYRSSKEEERLEWLRSDEEKIKLYKAREESLIEKMSLLDEAEERGIKKGIEQGKIDIAKEMILDGENTEKIKKYSKLNEKDIEKLRRELMPH